MADQEDTAVEQSLVGKRITAVERVDNAWTPDAPAVEDGKYVRLHFDDGSAAVIAGIGYDGLWDDVFVEVHGSAERTS